MSTAFPTDIYLDTSLATAAVIQGTKSHNIASTFCAQCATSGTRVYFSQLLRIELLQAIRSVGTLYGSLPEEIRRERRLARWGRDIEIRRSWMQYGVDGFSTLIDQFAEVYELPLTDDIWVRSADLMVTCQIDSYDAVHAATALELGVYDLATIDAHFTRVAELTVHLLRDSEPDA